MFKFDLEQQVKVNIHGTIQMGEVIQRDLKETIKGSRKTYHVQYELGQGCGGGEVLVGEKYLQEVQLLEVGVYVG